MIYLITTHDRLKRITHLDNPDQFKTDVWKSIVDLTAHKTILYGWETFNALNQKALPNRVNMIYGSRNKKTRTIPNILVTNNFKDIISTFGNTSEDLYIIGSTRNIIERFAKDIDFIIDYSSDDIGHTNQIIFDSINFADFTLLKKQECGKYDIRYFVREKTNFIGY